jgi:hypothetical protein
MVRYKPSQFTKKELEVMVGVLAVDKGLDFLTGGRINQLSKKAAVAAYRMVVRPVAARAIPSVAGATFGASRLLLTNPYILGGTAIYVGIKERDRIRALLEQGYEIVEEPARQYAAGVEQRTREFMADPVEAFQEAATQRPLFSPSPGRPIPAFFKAKRKPSSFNKAVSKGMNAIKSSTSYGKRGVITNAKKAFALVTKVASAKKKKKKAPKSGIRRKVWNAIGRLR